MGMAKEYTINKCKMGQGNDCCRYLTCSPDGFECEKHSLMSDYLDKRASENRMVAQADNCPGMIRDENKEWVLKTLN
jgi:hypothetical protein